MRSQEIASLPLTENPLADLQTERVKLLYLAKHAPGPGAPAPGLHPVLGITPHYHYEIYQILSTLGFTVESSSSLARLFSPPSCDYVFSLFNRARFTASEVFVSAICEYLRLPYLGANPHTRALAEDKHLTKLLARHLRIPVPEWKIYRRDLTPMTPPAFPGPYLAKPRCGAGSMDITDDALQDDWNALRRWIQVIHAHGQDALVECFVTGLNATVAVLGGDPPLVLPAVIADSRQRGNIITNRQKRLLDLSLGRYVLADDATEAVLKDLSLRLYQYLEPVDYYRADFRLPPASEPVLLEINICCNLGSHSSIVLAAHHLGLSQQQLIARILCYSLRRQGFRW